MYVHRPQILTILQPKHYITIDRVDDTAAFGALVEKLGGFNSYWITEPNKTDSGTVIPRHGTIAFLDPASARMAHAEFLRLPKDELKKLGQLAKVNEQIDVSQLPNFPRPLILIPLWLTFKGGTPNIVNRPADISANIICLSFVQFALPGDRYGFKAFNASVVLPRRSWLIRSLTASKLIFVCCCFPNRRMVFSWLY